MRPSQQILSAGLLIPTALAVSLYDTCNDVDGVWNNCEETFDSPYGAVKECTPSGSCSVRILTEKKTICAAVREGLPGSVNDKSSGEYFIKNLQSICGYLRSMQIYATTESISNYFFDGQVGPSINTIILDSLLHLDQSVRQDPLFYVPDNRIWVVQNMENSAAGLKAMKGADVTVDMYTKFMHATEGCWDGRPEENNCDANRLWNFFFDYVSLSTDVLYGEFHGVVTGWVTLFDSVLSNVASEKTAATNVQSHLKTATAKIDAIKKKICANSACSGPVATGFLKQVSTALASVKALDGVGAQADKAKIAAKSVQDLCTATINNDFAYPVDSTWLSDMVWGGGINYLGAFIKAFPITWNMKDTSIEMQSKVVPVILATKFQGRGATAATDINTVLATDWSKKSGSKTVRDGFTSIQSVFKTELRDYVSKLNTAMKSLDDTLNKFQLRKNDLVWNYDSSDVSRWTSNTFTLPCLYMKTKPYTIDGYTKSITYPTYYACTYGPETIDMPSHHIPYVQWGFKSNQK